MPADNSFVQHDTQVPQNVNILSYAQKRTGPAVKRGRSEFVLIRANPLKSD
jgi:hypothetical protein